MEKITEFKNIPKLIELGNYQLDFEPDRLIFNIEEWVLENDLQLDPDFQRGHVWTEEQQTAYVEFIFRGGETARTLYFNNPSWSRAATTEYNDFVIVDGKQRYEALRRFFSNEIQIFGSYRKDFTDSGKRINTIHVNVNTLQTRAEVLQWYLEFNSGGTPHTKEELDRVRKLLEEEKSKPKKKSKAKK